MAFCNLLIKPVDPKNFMTEAELEAERGLQHESASVGVGNGSTAARGAFGIGGVLAWMAVGIPFLIGVWIALAKAAALF